MPRTFFQLNPPTALARACAALLLAVCEADAAPRIAAPQSTFSFGWRDAAETVTNRFVLRNAGDAPLILGPVRTSCGCAKAEPERSLLQPGEQTVLEMRVALTGLQGPQRKSAIVTSNDPDTPALTLWIEGEACSPVSLDPSSVSFGRVSPDSPPSPITVRLTGYATNVTVRSATSDPPEFTVAVAPERRSFTVAAPQLAAPGAHRGQVRVAFSDPAQRDLTVHLYAWIDDLLRVVPSALAFSPGNAPAATRLVIVRPGTAKRFRITGVRIEGGIGHAQALPRPDGSCQVSLERVVPDTLTPDATLVISTDLAAHPEWRVPLRREGHAPTP